ncbi:sigma-70 family RNA polymerase sigma factor [Shinella curvata]|uniref:Sigma-70 family RNA polymerase sigma factor n=2 Tax=Shinella curvata TaxID=1817964 RepID=A0ABT8XF38_9HYPH|nr:sigma-70 family RNA polymerase sigma factor [Shinella curvata]MCJ8055373.1 sigma-70 family RNA polymerase sigma factor [Shinella curvata]MDO6121790.1 sigma-70 family RNA polymerase sigma factor [Shinella curvata]
MKGLPSAGFANVCGAWFEEAGRPHHCEHSKKQSPRACGPSSAGEGSIPAPRQPDTKAGCRTVQNNWLEELYVEARPSLLRRIGRKLGCHATASDLIQDVFLRLHERTGVLPEDAVAYVNRALYNAVIDHARAQRVRREFGDAVLPEQILSPAPSPLSALESRQEVRKIDDVIRALPERTRDIFFLNKINGYTYTDIAAIVGISKSAVEKHMARAMFACRAATE